MLFSPVALCFITFWHQTKSLFWHMDAGSLDGHLEDVSEVPLQWEPSTTLTPSTQEFLLIWLIYSGLLFCSQSCTAYLSFAGVMIDSFLIFLTELFPADAARSFAVHVEEDARGAWSESSAVSPNSPPDVTFYPSDCSAEWCDVSVSLRSAGTEARAASHICFSQHSSFHLFPESFSIFTCLFCNCHNLIFLSSLHFCPQAGKKYNLHTRLMCDTSASQLDSRSRWINVHCHYPWC